MDRSRVVEIHPSEQYDLKKKPKKIFCGSCIFIKYFAGVVSSSFPDGDTTTLC